MANTADKANSGKSQISFNNQKFDFQCVFANTKGRVNVPSAIIEQFIVEDNLYSVFSEAKLVIDDTNDTLENLVIETQGENPELKEGTTESPFQFNVDGMDSCIITIIPNFLLGCSQERIFRQDYFFIITDENTQIVGDNNKKLKMFFLKDIRQHILETTNSRWSTGEAKDRKLKKDKINVKLTQVGNTARKFETGLAIKDLLEQGLKDYSNNPPKFEDNWSTGEVQVFRSSCNYNSYMDDLEFLLDNHISDIDLDNCFLKARKDGSFSLKSVTETFDSVINRNDKTLYGKGLQDVFHISGEIASEDKSNVPKGSNGGPDSNASQQFDGIDSFHFMNMPSGDIQQQLPSVCVYNYDNFNKQFSLDYNSAHIDNTIKEAQKLYADKSHGETPTALVPTNDQKKQNKTIKFVHTGGTDSKERRKDGVNNLLSMILALAPCLHFNTEGSMHRVSGKFLALSNKKVEANSAAEKMIPGDWLVTSIRHVFLISRSQYLNDIPCIKPYTSQPLIAPDAGVTDLQAAPLNEGEQIV